jgi:hypothetical protein
MLALHICGAAKRIAYPYNCVTVRLRIFGLPMIETEIHETTMTADTEDGAPPWMAAYQDNMIAVTESVDLQRAAIMATDARAHRKAKLAELPELAEMWCAATMTLGRAVVK